jgi:hypothetical protein
MLEKYRSKLQEKNNGKNKEREDDSQDSVVTKKIKTEDSFDIWNNPMVRDIEKNMSESDKIKYKLEGEYLYNSINFEDPNETKIKDLVAYISELLKSGMHPSYLSEEDKQTLESVYGKEWYKNFGYKKEDLDSLSFE